MNYVEQVPLNKLNTMEILTENGVVSEIIGNKVKIQIPIKPECEECRSIFCSKSDANYNFLEVETTERFEIGDRVQIQLMGKHLTKASMMLFVFPMLILIGSVIFLVQINISAIKSAILGFLFVSVYFVVIKFKKILTIEPKIIKNNL